MRRREMTNGRRSRAETQTTYAHPVCSETARIDGVRTEFPLLRRFRLARLVEGDRLANERLERGLVNVFSFVDVDRAAYVSVEARVEETGGIFQRRALGEGQLDDILIGFSRAAPPARETFSFSR